MGSRGARAGDGHGAAVGTETSGARTGARDRPLDVLVVEDNSFVALGLRMLLEDHDCRTRVASTLADARRMILERPDWVILDLMLPDGDGAELLAEIRRNKLPVRVAVATGATDPERLASAERWQPERMLIKPVAARTLLRELGIVNGGESPDAGFGSGRGS